MKKNRTKLLATIIVATLFMQPLTVKGVWPFTKKPKPSTMAFMLTTTKKFGLKITSGIVGATSLATAFTAKQLLPKVPTLIDTFNKIVTTIKNIRFLKSLFGCLDVTST